MKIKAGSAGLRDSIFVAPPANVQLHEREGQHLSRRVDRIHCRARRESGNRREDMDKVAIPRHTWVAVCNGRRGLVLQNIGTPAEIVLHTIASYECYAEPTHELGHDAPGRATGPGGLPRSAFETPDLHTRAEQKFVARFASALDGHVSNTPNLRLVVVAPPRVLGWLRKELTPVLQHGLFAEIPKDIAQHDVSQIANELAA